MALAVAQDFGAEAFELNSRLVAANPADAGSRTRLARCYLQSGRLDEAEAQYREVQRLDPRSRIAAGGLEMVERQRHQGDATAEDVRVARTVRVRREAPAARRREPSHSTSSEPAPQIFTGFGPADFADLRACASREVRARFAPRVVDLVRRVNVLQSSVEAAGIREPGKRQLFRAGRAEVHVHQAHWVVFNAGGRWEPQFNIGMYGRPAAGNWLRIGLGFDLTDDGADADHAAVIARVRDHFRRFQEILASPRRSLFLGWMVKENGLIQYNEGGPRLDLREPSQAASLIAGADPERTEWVFFGKWLSPECPDEAAILADPVSLVRTIDRVFSGLVPLWRVLWE